MKIKEQIVNPEVICETVLTKVFGDDCTFDPYDYKVYCTLIEETLASLKH